MFILYLKDVVTLLNPEEVSRGECSRESGENAVEAEGDTRTLPMDIQTIEVGDEIQVATMPSSTTHTIILHTLRSKCMEYLRYDVVQPAKEPHIKSTGVRKNKNARENPTIYGR